MRVSVIGWLLILGAVSVPRCESAEEMLCAGTGSGHENDRVKKLGWNPLMTMGWEAAYHKQRSYSWLLNHNKDWFVYQYFKITVHPVKDLEGNYLNGWFNIKIKTKRENDEIFALAVWVEAFAGSLSTASLGLGAIGTFLKADEAVCQGEETITGQDDWILPCSATPKRSPVNPNMFIFTKQKRQQKIKSISLLWKASVSMCHFPRNLMLRFAISPVTWSTVTDTDDPTANLPDSKKYGPYLLGGSIQPKFYGAASPVFSGPSNGRVLVDCSVQDWNEVKWTYQTGELSVVAAVIELGHEHWKRDFFGIGRNVELDNDILKKRAVCRAARAGHSLFGGRCTKNIDPYDREFIYAEKNGLPQCDNKQFEKFKMDFEDFKTAGTYSKYLESNKADLRLYPDVSQVIQQIKHQEQKERARRRQRRHEQIQTTRRMQTREKTRVRHLNRSQIDFWAQDRLLACRSEEYSRNDELGLCLIDPPGKYIYGLRQWHAGAALVCTMFFNPICTYVARYLKGVVFMNRGHRVPARMWYLFHVNMLVPMMCMFATGVPVLRRQTTTYGVSKTNAAFYHRLFGYIVSSLPIIQIVTGILRPLELHPWRKIMIYLHWFLGFLFKYGCLTLCVTSYLIPGSPTAFISHMRTDEYPMIWKHPLPLIILASVAVDLLFHSILTLHVYLFDRRHRFQRYGYFPVLFAHVFDDENRNVNNYQVTLLEYNHQKRVFRFYAFLCFFELMVIFNVMYLFTFTDDLHAVGPMTCTHDENGHFYIPAVVSQDEELPILCPEI